MRRCLFHVSLAAFLLISPAFAFADARGGDAEDAHRRLEAAQAQLCRVRDAFISARAALSSATARQADALSALQGATAQAEASRQAINSAQNEIERSSVDLREAA